MDNLFLQYPKCSTCKKAKNYLEKHSIPFIDRDITIDNPTKKELMLWHKKSGLELKKFFNTSGLVYRELNLKDKIKDMTEDEMYEILSTNGKLVKRPLLISCDNVFIGFKEETYKALINE